MKKVEPNVEMKRSLELDKINREINDTINNEVERQVTAWLTHAKGADWTKELTTALHDRNEAISESEKLDRELDSLKEELNRFKEFYFFMRNNHGHNNVPDALECRICKAMETAKEIT